MSTVQEIEQTISQLPPRDIQLLRLRINRMADTSVGNLKSKLARAGWLEQTDPSSGEISGDIPVNISGEPLSQTIMEERR
ncbi:MAG: hypothetical protein ACOYMN_06910 [Roseimicrobium sp.]